MPVMARTASSRPPARRGTSTPSRAAAARKTAGRTSAPRRRPTAAERRAREARARRTRIALITVVSTVSAITLVLVVGVALLLGSAVRAFDDERTWDISEEALALPPAAAYDTEQLANAAVIMRAGRDLLLPPRDQAIAVMTAMGESSLRNIDYGDWETNGVTNPDGSPTSSIGLFQQQDWWGTREQRLDPYTAATLFYQRMIKIPAAEREALAPTEVAHRTQINADPDHYTRYWPAAVRIVEDLSGTDTGLAPTSDR